MTYIVKERKELKIITVRMDQEDFFQADYAGRILASGNNTMEALMNFGQLPESYDINDKLNENELPE
jgi:hypothetical protein